jgi:cholera toxin transcriptional activator
MSSTAKKIFRFGLFEADASSGELRKAGVRLRLQDQPFQVLLIFLERPGEVLSREEIRQRLWPSDTFVDFDHSLNTVINKIREALGDSAANPRFVETLAKRGYRFLAPVDSVLETSPEKIDTHAATDNSAENPSSQPNLGLTRMEDLPVVPHTYVRTLFLLIQTMYLIFYLVALGRLTVAHGVLDRLLGGHPAAIIVLIVFGQHWNTGALVPVLRSGF